VIADDCLRLPLSLEDADSIIGVCSGVAEWRPLFVLGLQSAGILVLIVAVVIWALWRFAR
jgi:hypothetical protein